MTDPVAVPPYLVERSPGYLEYQLPVSVKLVVDYRGKVPLLKNERDEWELPGGKLELGESPETTVCREVAEELGLTISTVDIVDSWVYAITPVRHVFIVSYGACYTGDKSLSLSAEHKQLGLFAYDDVPHLPMPEPYKVTVARWEGRVRGHRDPVDTGNTSNSASSALGQGSTSSPGTRA